MVVSAGSLATISCEPGQTWKGAAAAVDLCAGKWLVLITSIFLVDLWVIIYHDLSGACKKVAAA